MNHWRISDSNLPEQCGHSTTIGSYPGDQRVSCDLPIGHKDEHEAKVWWWHHFPECDQAVAPS